VALYARQQTLDMSASPAIGQGLGLAMRGTALRLVASSRPPLERLTRSGAMHVDLRCMARLLPRSEGTAMVRKLLFTAVAVLMLASEGLAQEVRTAPQIVDLPVFAADGIKIGRVADVSMVDGRIDQIRISTGSTMGFGERIVTIPQPAFTIRGDMVMIPDLSSEDVAALPSDTFESHSVDLHRKATTPRRPLR